MNAKEIVSVLDSPGSKYPREAIDAAMAQKDDVIPLLLDDLRFACEDPYDFFDAKEESFIPIFAVYFLGLHRVREAHPLLISLASLPGELPFHLFGDAVHELFPTALWNTCGGDPTDIIGLIRNKTINEYCRTAAVWALPYGIVENTLSRETVIVLLQGLFSGDESSRDEPMIWNSAAEALTELWPGESMDILRKAYSDGLIEPDYIALTDIENKFNQGKEARLAKFKEGVERDINRTPHEELQMWSHFSPASARAPSPSRDSKNKRSTEKKKRKQARAARKKGRSKKKK